MSSASAVGLAVAVLAVMRFAGRAGGRVAIGRRRRSGSRSPREPSRRRRRPLLRSSTRRATSSRGARPRCRPRSRARSRPCSSRKGSESKPARSSRASTTRTCGRKSRKRRRRSSSSARTLTAAQVAFDNAGPMFDAPPRAVRGRVHQCANVRRRQGEPTTPRKRISTSRAAHSSVAEASLAVTQRNLDDTVVRAPFGGIVTVKAAQEGEMVSPISAGGGFTRTGIGTDRRHGLARGRGRRQRELHQPRADRAARRDHAERVSGPALARPRHRHHSDGRSRQGHRQGTRRLRASATQACCPRWARASRS